jgi:hypothetical protein
VLLVFLTQMLRAAGKWSMSLQSVLLAQYYSYIVLSSVFASDICLVGNLEAYDYE